MITGDIKRRLLALYVNVGTESAPEWEMLGYKVEESSIEYNWDIETITDIRGITTSSINKSEPSQSMDGYRYNKDSKFLQTLNSSAVRNAYTEMTSFEVLTAYGFLRDEAGKCLAKREKNCTITPESIGGSGNIEMPFTIAYSNDFVFGSIQEITSSPTFTEGTAA